MPKPPTATGKKTAGSRATTRKTASVVFRRVVSSPGGKEQITEEREVRCDPGELTRVLGAPWDHPAAVVLDPERVRCLAEQSVEQFTALQLAVRERHSEHGRTWLLSVLRPGEQPEEVLAAAPASSKPEQPVRLSGSLKACVQGDQGAVQGLADASGRNALLVHNQGVTVINKDNVYAIVDLSIHVTIQS